MLREAKKKKLLVKQIIQKREEIRQKKKKICSESFYMFNKYVMRWPDFSYPLHKEMCDFVQYSKKKKLLMLVARGHLKSSIITVSYACWRIAKNPAVRIFIGNATYNMATAFLGQIKNVLQKNDVFRDLYGDLTLGAEKWSNDMIKVGNDSYQAKEATVTSYGMGGSLVSQHYDLILMDDVVARENIGTKEQRDKTLLFYKDALDLLEPGGQVIVIGTTWHENDLYGYIMDDENKLISDFDIFVKPAYEGNWGEGIISFPEKFSWEILDELKRQKGPSEFSAQYLLNPIPEENATFKSEYFQKYEDWEIRGRHLNRFMAVDPAISESKEADFSAIVVIGVDQWNNWYVLDLFMERVGVERLIGEIFHYAMKHKPIEVAVEMEAYAKSLRFYMAEEMKRRNFFFNITELRSTRMGNDKEYRIKGLEPRYFNGLIFHNKYLSRTADLEDQLRSFPRAKHDDLIDALSFLNEVAFKPRKGGEEEGHHKSKYLYNRT